jgi:hypothetical protein
VPFRTLQVPAVVDLPARQPPPALLAFGVHAAGYHVVARAAHEVRVIAVPRLQGGARTAREVDVGCKSGCVAAVRGREWGVFADDGLAVVAWAGGRNAGSPTWARAHGEERFAGFAPVVLDDESPCVALAHAERGASVRGPCIRILGTESAHERVGPWHAPPSARALLAATGTVLGPVVVFATDRDDEIDVCAWSSADGGSHRTVSLGRGQRFECAAGGGSRIAVVSRGAEGIVVRTIARDLRSELNTAPLVARHGRRIGAVRCAYASGPFVVAHAEHGGDDERDVVVTVFDGAHSSSARFPFPGVDALVVEGRDVLVAALVGGASAPLLFLERLMVGRRHDGGPAELVGQRCYVYLLAQPAGAAQRQRHALLADAAEVLARSLSARGPRNLALRAHDERADVATFVIHGPDAARDLNVALLVRDDGSAVASVRIGEGLAPEPRALNFVERVRTTVTGDNDGDPRTVHLEVPSLACSIEDIVATVWGLRLVR